MRKHRRFAATGLVALFAAAAAIAACSGDDSTGAGGDAGGDAADASSSDVTQPKDSSTDGGGGLRGNVFAYNNLVTKISAVRICFAASTGAPGLADGVDMTPQPADPAGLQPGFGTLIDGPPELVGNNVRVFVYYVQSLEAFGASGDTCKQLLAMSYLTPDASDAGDAGDAGSSGPPTDGGALLIQTADFDSYVLEAGSFSGTARNFLIAQGCPASSDSAKLNLVSGGGHGYCGDSPSFQALGDFHVYSYSGDSTAPTNASENRLQAQEALTFAEYITPGVEFYLDVEYNDGGTITPIPGPIPNDIDDSGIGGWSYVDASTPLLPIPGTEVGALSGASAFDWTADIGLGGQLDPASTFAFSGGAPVPGKTYTFFLVGSYFEPPTLADGGPNPVSLGVRILPNQ